MQEITDPLLPTTLGGWLASVGEAFAIAAVVATAVWRLLMQSINGLGARVDRVEERTSRAEEGRRVLERSLDRGEMVRDNLHEQIGRLEGLVENLASVTKKNRQNRAREDRETAERLTRMETKLDNVNGFQEQIIDLLGQRFREH